MSVLGHHPHGRSEIPDLSVPKSRFAARCPARCPAALGVIPVLYGLRRRRMGLGHVLDDQKKIEHLPRVAHIFLVAFRFEFVC